jgi:hypothetical protein
LSLYTPQKGEQSNEIPTPKSRQRLLAELPRLKTAYPALILPDDTGKAFAESPKIRNGDGLDNRRASYFLSSS